MSDDGVDDAKRATLRRFAALGAVPLAAGRSAGTSEQSEAPLAREAIRGYVSSTPGAHFSQLRDDLGLGTGGAQYHLRHLLDAGAIESLRDGEYRRYYPADRFSRFEQVALGYLRRETARGMVLALLADPGRSGVALAEDLGVSRATISDWAGKLSEAGLLSRSDGYAIQEPETVLVLLIRYAESLGPEAVAFADEAADRISIETEQSD